MKSKILKTYRELKARYGETILLFEVNETYEIFGIDAEIVAKELGLILTKRTIDGEKISRSGFPKNMIDSNLPKIIRSIGKVALVTELKAPEKIGTRVKRNLVKSI